MSLFGVQWQWLHSMIDAMYSPCLSGIVTRRLVRRLRRRRSPAS